MELWVILFLHILVSAEFIGHFRGENGSDSPTTITTGEYSVNLNKSEYLQPFFDLSDHLNCREEKCTPQDCQYNTSLAFDVEIEKQLICSCHLSCYAAGHCCLNFEEVCLAGNRSQWIAETFPHEAALIELSNLPQHKEEMLLTEYYKTLTNLRSQLILITAERIQSQLYNVISKCSACGPNSTCQEISDLCERTVLKELGQFVPVVIGNQFYANKYCAQCTPDTDMRNMTAIVDSLDVGCTEGLEGILELYQNGHELQILQAIQSGNCKVTIPKKSYDSLNKESLRGLPFDIFKSCNNQFRDRLENFNEIDTACRSYSASYALRKRHGVYAVQNKHCALCNIEELNRYEDWCLCFDDRSTEFPRCVGAGFSRGTSGSIPKPFFEIALDFRGAAELRMGVFDKCGATEYLDVNARQCTHRECYRGFYKYGQRCLSEERFEFVESSLSKHFQLCMLVDGEIQGNVDVYELQRDYHRILAGKLFMNSGYEYKSMSCIGNSGFDFANLKKFMDTTQILYETEISDFVDLAFIRYLMEDYSSLMGHLSKNYPVRGLVVYFGDQNLCPNGTEKREYDDFSLTWDGDGWLSSRYVDRDLRDSGQVYFADMALSINFSNISAGFSIMKDGDNWMLNMSASFCFQVNESCLVDPPSSVDCLEPIRKSELSYIHSQIRVLHSWQTTLTLVCAFLSCIALISTLIIHYQIPGIMKSGGNAFTQLVVSLLLAESCLIFSAFVETGDGIACISLAVVLHFAWLCAFFWTFLLSLDIFCVFVLFKKKSQKFDCVAVGYSLFGWGVPTLVVISCISLHLAGHFNYGGSVGCWIESPIQLGLAFGLPVAAVIAANVTMYIVIVMRLHKQMSAATEVGQVYDLKTRFILFSKMSTIVGFTWIFGFLANIKALSFLAYVFSITAALNGLLVSCAFTISSHSIRLIKERWASSSNF